MEALRGRPGEASGVSEEQSRERSRSRGARRCDVPVRAAAEDADRLQQEVPPSVPELDIDDAVESAAGDVNSRDNLSDAEGRDEIEEEDADQLEALFERFEEFFADSAIPAAPSDDALRDICSVCFCGETAASIKQDAQCVICLVEFTDGEQLEQLPHCGHLFHGGCIRRWLERTSSCPICRQTLFARGEGLGPGVVASIEGHRTSPELNGCAATCIRHDADGRWLVRLPCQSEKKIKSENLRCIKKLATGAGVRTTGLSTAMSHLNNIRGCCLQWKSETGRWHVRLANGEEKAFRPANLEVDPGAASSTDHVLSHIERVMEEPEAIQELDSLVREVVANPSGARHVHRFMQQFVENPELQSVVSALPDGQSILAALGDMVADPTNLQRRLAAAPPLVERLVGHNETMSAMLNSPAVRRLSELWRT